MTKEYMFEQMDKNKSGFIDQQELKEFCTINNLIEGLTTQDIEKLFVFLDIGGDGEVSCNELASLI